MIGGRKQERGEEGMQKMRKQGKEGASGRRDKGPREEGKIEGREKE
jgi:hypothetical protein